jgi:hypothetical protein
MCNVFSGHIVSDKDSKKFGEIIYKTGVHHEKDREEIDPKLKIVAWETVAPMSFKKGFQFPHSQGDITEKTKTELMKLLDDWSKKQDIKELSKSFLTVTKDGKVYDDYTIGEMTVSCLEDNISMICDVNGLTQTAGYYSTQTAGYRSTQKAGNESTQTAGYESTQKAGDRSTQKAGDMSTQKAGYDSTQKAGYESTQTAGNESTQIILGEMSCIILDGENVTLIQKYDGKTYTLSHDDLFAKGFKKGDKFKVIKGITEKI